MNVPTPDEQVWLLERMAEVIASGGRKQFLEGLLLQPTEQFFPDPWEPNARGVERLALRLLGYAGLGELDVVIETFAEERSMAMRGMVEHHRGTAAYFAGIDGQTVYFGVEASQLGVPEAVVGAMCHEVAHAFRHFRRLQVGDRREEELRTDVTAVYLGFGALTVNAAELYRSGIVDGDFRTSRWQRSSLGYLPYQAMCFLLGAQTVSRGMDRKQHKALAGHLESNQSGSFLDACKLLRQQAALPGLLGLSGPEIALPVGTRSRPERSTAAVGEVPQSEPAAEDAAHSSPQPVFRYREHSGVSYAFIAGAFLGPFAVGRNFASGQFALGTAAWAALIALGYSLGRRRGRDRCSECKNELAPDLERCPECGGIIRGRIRNRDERLAAQEALFEGR